MSDPSLIRKPAPPVTPAGWHPDPELPGSLRYWNGTEWTEHRAPDATGPLLDEQRKLRALHTRVVAWVVIVAIAAGAILFIRYEQAQQDRDADRMARCFLAGLPDDCKDPP